MSSLYYMAGLGIGLTVAVQSAINNQLKIALGGSTLLAALVSFAVGGLCLLGIYWATGQRLSQLALLHNTPWWMLLGGVLGAAFVFGSTLLVPKLGLALMISLIVFGQIIMSLLMDHYGWLGVPVQEINLTRLLGAGLVLAGVLCVNFAHK